MKKFLAVGALIALTASAHAAGTDLLRDCNAAIDSIEGRPVRLPEAFAGGRCHGTIFSALTTASLYASSIPPALRACPPAMGGEQAIRMMVKWLRTNPEHLSDSEAVVVVLAFREAYPCPAN